jgi:hypothetical protein
MALFKSPLSEIPSTFSKSLALTRVRERRVRPHPMFGKLKVAEWGKLLQIHIDYHLKQFAA